MIQFIHDGFVIVDPELQVGLRIHHLQLFHKIGEKDIADCMGRPDPQMDFFVLLLYLFHGAGKLEHLLALFIYPLSSRRQLEGR
ncbi:hypothetical protein [Rossellomorea marisflavi]|uniref:hypothetical protein n=1 Tax=Rossellomorea marisflavi TaxID=189381 RepID=UPI0034597541